MNLLADVDWASSLTAVGTVAGVALALWIALRGIRKENADAAEKVTNALAGVEKSVVSVEKSVVQMTEKMHGVKSDMQRHENQIALCTARLGTVDVKMSEGFARTDAHIAALEKSDSEIRQQLGTLINRPHNQNPGDSGIIRLGS